MPTPQEVQAQTVTAMVSAMTSVMSLQLMTSMVSMFGGVAPIVHAGGATAATSITKSRAAIPKLTNTKPLVPANIQSSLDKAFSVAIGGAV